MKIHFDHRSTKWTFDTVNNLLQSRFQTIPLMNCSEDLRNAAVRAKVDLLRMRSRTQHNPLDLQGITNDQEAAKQSDPYQHEVINGVGLVRTESAAD